MKKGKTFFVVLLCISLFALGLNAQEIFYQGKITGADGIGLNGDFDVIFRIYDSNTGGTLLDEYTAYGVAVEKGLFASSIEVELEDDALFSTLWLEVEFDGDVMEPRQKVTAEILALGAFHAQEAESAESANYALTAGYADSSTFANVAHYADTAGAVNWDDIVGVPSDFGGSYGDNVDAIAVDGHAWLTDSIVFEAGENVHLSQTGNRIIISSISDHTTDPIYLGSYIVNQFDEVQDADFWIDGHGIFGGDTSHSDRDIITGEGPLDTYNFPMNGNSYYWRSVSLIRGEELGLIEGDLAGLSMFINSHGFPLRTPFYYHNVTIWVEITTDTIAPLVWNTAGATEVVSSRTLSVPMVDGTWFTIMYDSDVHYDDGFNVIVYMQGEQHDPYMGYGAAKWRMSPLGNDNMQRYASSPLTYPTGTMSATSYRADLKLTFENAIWNVDQVSIYDGFVDIDNDVTIGGDVYLDGAIYGDVISDSIAVSDLYSITGDPADTIWAHAQFRIDGELIADSIQAVGDVIYMDDSTYVEGNLNVSNNATIGNDLDVIDDAYVGNDLEVTRNALVGQDLSVYRDGYFGNNVNVSNNAYVDNDLSVTRDGYFGHNVEVTNSGVYGNDILVQGSFFGDSLYTIEGDLNDTIWANANFAVHGEVIADSLQAFGNLFTIDDSTHIKGDLRVDGTIYGDIVSDSVFTDHILSKEGNLEDTVGVHAQMQIDGELIVDSIQAVGSMLMIDDSASIDGNFHVWYDAYVDNDLFVNQSGYFGNNIEVLNDANIGNDAYVGNDLDVIRNGSIGNDLDVTRNTYVGNDLNVTRNTYVGNDLEVTRDGYIGNDLDVTRDGYIGNDLDVTNDASVGNDLDVTRNGYFGNNLNVSNDGTFGNDINVANSGFFSNDVTVQGSFFGDSLFTRTGSMNDTIWANANFAVHGEVIADSLQAFGNLFTIDDSTHIRGDLRVDGTIYGDIVSDSVFTDHILSKDGNLEDTIGVHAQMQIDGELIVDSIQAVGSMLMIDDSASVDGNFHVWNNAFVDHDLDVTNDASVGNDLDVANDGFFGNNIDVTNNATVGNDLDVTRDASIGNDLDVIRDTYIGNDVDVTRDAYIGNDLDVTRNGTFGNNLDVTNDATIGNDASVGNDLDVTRNGSFGNNLDVTNDATIGNDLDVTNDASVGNDLTVTRDGYFGNDLDVTNTGTFGNDVIAGGSFYGDSIQSFGELFTIDDSTHIRGDLRVDGTIYGDLVSDSVFTDNILSKDGNLEDTIGVHAQMQIDGELIVDSIQALGSMLMIDDSATVDGNLRVMNNAHIVQSAHVYDDVHVYDDLFVDSDAIIGMELVVNRNAYFHRNINVDSTANIGVDANIGNDLDVSRDAYIGNNLDVTNDATVGNDLDVTRDGSFGNNLDVTNDASVGNDLTVTRDGYIGNDLDVTNTGTFGNDVIAGGSFYGDSIQSFGELFTIDDSTHIRGDLRVDGTIYGDIVSDSVFTDHILSKDGNLEDTIGVHAQMRIDGELIADSIQAVGSMLMIDDSATVDGNLNVNNDIYIAGGINDGTSTGAADQIILADGLGHFNWIDYNRYWEFVVSDADADTSIQTIGQWGISRNSNTLIGNMDHTHINLGLGSTTGELGENWEYNTIGGGFNNTASHSYSTISGGSDNQATAAHTTIGGGYTNTASFEYATVAGGNTNTASGNSSFVGGGETNVASAPYSAIIGGLSNAASNDYSFVGGGQLNTSSAQYSAVIGGSENTAAGDLGVVVGGYQNAVAGNSSAIVGGIYNNVNGEYSYVGGGMYNTADGNLAAIPGGSFLTVGEGSFGFRGIVGGVPTVVTDVSADTSTFDIVDAHFRFNYNQSDADFRVDGDNNTNVFFMDASTDRVGIGTDTPSELLDVAGDVLIQDSLVVSDRLRVTGTSTFEDDIIVTAGIDDDTTGTGIAGQVLTADGVGGVLWADSDPDKYWEFRITDTADTTVVSKSTWGLSRAGNDLYGTADSTHINWGVASTTGEAGSDWKYATVGGGYNNTAGHQASTVAGGSTNSASERYAAVAGGFSNSASYDGAFVGGGSNNSAENDHSAITGGSADTVRGDYSIVGGGYHNVVTGNYSVIGGGNANTASGATSAIIGGASNSAAGSQSIVAGGFNNTTNGLNSAINGGSNNTTDFLAFNSVVAGGESNTMSAGYSVISGGMFNTVELTGENGTIGGGSYNTISGMYGAIPGGAYLEVGTGSFGYRGRLGTPATSLDLSAETNTFHLANVAFHHHGNHANADFIVDGNTLDNLIFADADSDYVGIGKNDPRYLLDVGGDLNIDGDLTIGGAFNVTSFAVDTIKGNALDTIHVINDFKVYGELIADSIQAVADTLYIDDNVVVNGALYASNTVEVLSDLLDADDTGAVDGSFLRYDALSSEWVVGAETQQLSDVLSVGNTANMNIDMNTFKFDNVAAATVPGEVLVWGNTAGGDLTGTYPNPTILAGAVSDDEIDYTTVTLSDFTDDVGFAHVADLADDDTLTTPVNWLDIAGMPANVMDSTLGDLTDVDVTGAVDGSILVYDDLLSEWVVGAENQSLAEVLTVDNTANMNIDMNTFKFDNVAAATAPGEAIVWGNAAGGDLTGTYPNPTIDAGAVSDDEIDYATVTLSDFTDDVGFATAADLSDDDTLTTPVNWGDIAGMPDNVMDSTLASLSDVDVTGVADGNILIYDALNSEWIDGTEAQGMDEILSIDNSANMNIDMNTFKFTNVGAATLAGEVLTWGNAAGGDLTGTYPNPTIDAGAVSDDEIDYTTVTLADFTDDVGFAEAADLSDDDTLTTPVNWGDIAGIPDNVMDSTLAALTDVDLTGLLNGQVLKYNNVSGNFEPGDDNTGGFGTYAEIDSISAFSGNVNDTVFINNNLRVRGELIVDSIQAVGDEIFIDDQTITYKEFLGTYTTADTLITNMNLAAINQVGGQPSYMSAVSGVAVQNSAGVDITGTNFITGGDFFSWQLPGSAAIANAYGSRSLVDREGATAVNKAYGVVGLVRNTGNAGSIAHAAGVYSKISNGNAGTATVRAYGMLIDTTDVSAGSVSWNYGLYIADQSGVGAFNYALYSEGGDAFFGGDLYADAWLYSDTILANADTVFILDNVRATGKIHSAATVALDDANVVITKGYADPLFANDDVTDDDIGDLADVNDVGITDGQILAWNNVAGEYQPGTISDDQTDVEVALTDTVDFAIISGETEVHGALDDLDLAIDRLDDNNPLTTVIDWDDLSDIPTGFADGTDDDDITDDVIGDLSDVNVAGVTDGQVLTYNNVSGDWEAADADDDQTDVEVALTDTVDFSFISGETEVHGALDDLDLALDQLDDNNPLTTPVDWDDLSDIPAGFSDGTDDDDITDDVIGDLSDVNDAGITDGQVLAWNNVAGEYQPVDDADTDDQTDVEVALTDTVDFAIITGETDVHGALDDLDLALDRLDDNNPLTTVIDWDDLSDIPAGFSDGTDDDDITDDVIGDLSDVSVAGATNGQVLTYNNVSGDWEATDAPDNQTDVEVALTDTVDFNFISGETEVHGALDDLDLALNQLDDNNPLTTPVDWDDLSDVPAGFSDGTDDDDITDDVIGSLSDVNDAGITDGQILAWNNVAGEYQPADLADDQTDAQVPLTDTTDFAFVVGETDVHGALDDLDLSLDRLDDNNPLTTPVDWDDLSDVPAGFSDGTDDDDITDDVIGSLSDVSVAGATNGQVLTYNNVSGDWEAADVAASQTDVTVPLTSTGDFNIIAGETEVHGALDDLDLAIDQLNDDNPLTTPVNWLDISNEPSRVYDSTMSDLTDVDLTGLADGNILVYDGLSGNWEPGAAPVGAVPTTIEVDTIFGSAHDTIYVMNDFNVLGELIADSIQAVGDTIFMDDNVRIAGKAISNSTLLADPANVLTTKDYVDARFAADDITDDQLGSLSNVDLTGLADGDALVYDNLSGNWEPSTITGTDDQTDVEVGLANAALFNIVSGESTVQGAIDDLDQAIDDLNDGNSATTPVTWNDLSSIPAGFSDGTDDDDLTNNDLSDIGDVDVTGINNGDALVWNSVSSTWEPTSVASGTDDQNDSEVELADTTLFTVISGTTTVQGALDDLDAAVAAVTVPNLNDLTDVNTAGVTNGQVIKWNSVSGDWEAADDNGGAATATLSDVLTNGNTANMAIDMNTNDVNNALDIDFSGSLSRTGNTVFDGTVINLGTSSTTSNDHATVGGGGSNTASGSYSTVSGGYNNTASGDYAIVSGGYTNAVTGSHSLISGGRDNSVENTYSVIVGGQGHRITSQYAAVFGGANDTITGNYSSILGGNLNKVTGMNSTILGGYDNTVTGHYSTILSGQNNAAGSYSVVSGGVNLTVGTGSYGFRGYLNTAATDLSVEPNTFHIVDALFHFNFNNNANADFVVDGVNDGLLATDASENEVSVNGTFVMKLDTDASAASLTLGDGNVFNITGTTNITSITAKPAGTVVYLIFDNSLTVVDGGNLMLSSNFNATADDVLTLVSDGTNWYEVSRSGN